MIAVGRHVNGVTINPLEYLLDEKGDIEVFDNEIQARKYLRNMGLSEDDMYWLVFEEVG